MSTKHRISPITRVEREQVHTTADEIVVEAPLAITLLSESTAPKSLAVTMRSPGDDPYLCAGFLLTEGIIQSASDISSGLYVRGGGPDQTRILLDQVPLYNSGIP